MKPAWLSTSQVSAASRPVGAKTRTRSAASLSLDAFITLAHQSVRSTRVDHVPGEDSLHLPQFLSDPHAAWPDLHLADRRLVRSPPLLHHRDRLLPLSRRFEE